MLIFSCGLHVTLCYDKAFQLHRSVFLLLYLVHESSCIFFLKNKQNHFKYFLQE